MYYGQLKIASENFYRDHESLIEGALKGVLTGGVVSAVNEYYKPKAQQKQHLQHILAGAGLGGVTGGAMGAFLDENRPEIERRINDLIKGY
jgi:hypothetical protein